MHGPRKGQSPQGQVPLWQQRCTLPKGQRSFLEAFQEKAPPNQHLCLFHSQEHELQHSIPFHDESSQCSGYQYYITNTVFLSVRCFN